MVSKFSGEKQSLACKLNILCNHILRLHNINEGYCKLPFGSIDEFSNYHPFNLTIYTNSDRIIKIIRNDGRRIKKEINKAMKLQFKKDKKELLERQIMYFKSPYEYSVILNIKFYDWKIKKIIIQDLIDDGENIDYKLNSLERSAPNLGYYFKGYNIP